MLSAGIQTAANGMQALLDQNDAVAHNLANVNTVGYKKASLTFKSLYDAKVEQSTNNNDPKNQNYQYVGNLSLGAVTDRSVISFSQGTLQRTDNTYDLAIDGDGFFKTQDPNGKISYTRNGQFTIDSNKRLTTLDGDTVLDVKNKPIKIDLQAMNATAKDVSIREKGEVVVSNPQVQATLQQIAIVDFSDKTNMMSLGNARFAPTNPNQNPELKADKYNIQQGALELSNSSTVNEMINSINVSRNYETLSKFVKEDAALIGTAINLGRLR